MNLSLPVEGCNPKRCCETRGRRTTLQQCWGELLVTQVVANFEGCIILSSSTSGRRSQLKTWYAKLFFPPEVHAYVETTAANTF